MKVILNHNIALASVKEAHTLYEQRRYKDALAACERALATEPGDTKLKRYVIKSLGRWLFLGLKNHKKPNP